ncbi:hypothetical protein MINS_16290 [Mycolicibacterium insubricum]|nr:hypothetical protein MINS_16290 [Mycolicibacterium insubricum]
MAAAIADRISVRLVSDLEPGTATVALTGARATGAGQRGSSDMGLSCQPGLQLPNSARRVGRVRSW